MIMREEGSTAGNAGELCSLAEAVCNGTIKAAQYERLNALLAADEEAARFYATYLRMHGLLLWHWRDADVPSASSPALPNVVEAPSLPAVPTPLFTNLLSPGGYLFSYAVAVFVVGVGLLIGWAYQVPHSQEAATTGPHLAAATASAEREAAFVGRITGLIGCRWADPTSEPSNGAQVSLGRKYVLLSGLMEITYDTGAKVILEGPCTYKAESRSGGYLARGRLTARVGKRGEGRREKDEHQANQPATVSDKRSPSPLAALPSPLFCVRTPTATVSDLGTEFSVEVDGFGVSRAQVYEGKVELRALGGGNSEPILLEVDESARVDVGRGGVAAIVRKKGQKSTFVREIPKLDPIVVFNTGVGLKEGEADPHWQVVARSDDPKFKPQAALLRGPGNNALQNDPSRSQWISLVGGDGDLPEDVVYVFRTTFDLTGMRPSTAILRGRFLADDRVVAIRLNGRNLSVALQPEGGPFVHWTKFFASAGFVEGTNVLEFDVLNADPLKSPVERRIARSRVSCRVELEAEAARTAALNGKGVSGKVPQAWGVETNKSTAKEAKATKQENSHST